MSDIDYLSATSYGHGRDPIEWAEVRVSQLIGARDNLLDNRPAHLPPLPAWPDLGDNALARKILGALMDAGWSPPAEAPVQSAIAHARAEEERHEAWKASLPPGVWERAMEHYARTGELPPDVRPPAAKGAA